MSEYQRQEINLLKDDISRRDTKIKQLQEAQGEMRLVLESQDLRLKKFHDDNARLREAIKRQQETITALSDSSDRVNGDDWIQPSVSAKAWLAFRDLAREIKREGR